jgi:hypothetical protein
MRFIIIHDLSEVQDAGHAKRRAGRVKNIWKVHASLSRAVGPRKTMGAALVMGRANKARDIAMKRRLVKRKDEAHDRRGRLAKLARSGRNPRMGSDIQVGRGVQARASYSRFRYRKKSPNATTSDDQGKLHHGLALSRKGRKSGSYKKTKVGKN